jgi:hypothetical protein
VTVENSSPALQKSFNEASVGIPEEPHATRRTPAVATAPSENPRRALVRTLDLPP